MQQANAFWNGERRYFHISSHMGYCMYPAGHLYHYAFIFLQLNLRFENWLYLARFIHGIMHTVIIACITDIAYNYFPEVSDKKAEGVDRSRSARAQMIAFVFMAWVEERIFNIEMWNDQLMIFYIVLSVYSFVKGYPTLGTLFFSLSFSMKAGAVLLIPAMLGMIQYNHGTIQLMVSAIITVGFVVAISLPFTYFGDTNL